MRKILVGVVGVFACLAVTCFAATRATSLNDQFLLNRAQPGAMQKTQLGTKVVFEQVRQLRAYWDFTKQGGAISTITLQNAENGKAATLPKGAIVRDCIFDIVTPPSPTVSPSPTLSFSTGQTTADLKAATAAVTYTGLLSCVPTGSAATAIKLTADSTLTMTIASQALLAGKIYVLIEYVLSSTN